MGQVHGPAHSEDARLCALVGKDNLLLPLVRRDLADSTMPEAASAAAVLAAPSRMPLDSNLLSSDSEPHLSVLWEPEPPASLRM